MKIAQLVIRSSIMVLAAIFMACAKATTETGTPLATPTSCTYDSRPNAYPSTYDFTALPSGFTHTAATDQIIASAGVGVLQSLGPERVDSMYGPTTLSTTNRKLRIDFSFTGAAGTSNTVTLYSNDIAGANTYYHAQISKAGSLSVLKLLNGNLVINNSKFISTAPQSGTLELTICNGRISATVGSDSVSGFDEFVTNGGRIGFMISQTVGGTAGSVSVDNFGVFVP